MVRTALLGYNRLQRMKRFAAIFLSILLGAAVVAIGMGIFLYKANVDRKQLAEIATAANDQARQSAAERERAIHEANNELDTAKSEIAKAQATVAALKEEREALSRATVLTTPTSKTLRGWMEIVSLPLKMTLSLPPKSIITENTDTRLIAYFETKSAIPPSSELLITPYSTEQEQFLLKTIENSTPVSYAVNGHLLQGVQGKYFEGTTTTLVTIQLYNQKTHIIRIATPRGTAGPDTVRTILSSIDIAP